MTKVDYTLSGCANGHPVLITGAGSATPRAVRLRFVAAEAPFTFDSSFAHLVAVDVIAAVAGGLVAAHDDPVVARCRIDLLGEGGVHVGTIVALATLEQRRRPIACTAQLAETRVAMEVGEQLTSIDERSVTTTAQASGVVLFSAAVVSTSRGRELTAIATTLVVGCDGGGRRTLTLMETLVPASRAGAARRATGRTT